MEHDAIEPSRGFSTGRPFRPLSDNAAQQNVAAQQADPASLLAHYRGLIGLRNRLPSIARGSYQAAAADGPAFRFQRRLDGERTLVLVNTGRGPHAWQLEALGAQARLTPQWPAGSAPAQADAQGRLALTQPAQSVLVYTLN